MMASPYDVWEDPFEVNQVNAYCEGETDHLLSGNERSSFLITLPIKRKSSRDISPVTTNDCDITSDICLYPLTVNAHHKQTAQNGSVSVGEGTCHEQEQSSDHCHRFEDIGDDTTARNQLITVSALCFLFMCAEIIGGLLANSISVAADATHMASDLAGFLISLFAISLKRSQATARMSFGYYRAEVLGALISILIIWIVTAVLVGLAVHRVQDQTFTIDSTPMLITASVGVAFNIVMGAVLHFKGCNIKSAFGHSHGGHGHSHGGHGHSHGGHGHSHDGEGHSHDGGGHSHAEHGHSHAIGSCETSHQHSGSRVQGNRQSRTPVNSVVMNDAVSSNRFSVGILSEDAPLDDDMLIIAEDVVVASVGSKANKTNINVRAAFIHVIGDFIQSIGVLVAAIVIRIWPQCKLADPICTFIFSLFVLCTTLKVLYDILIIIMEGVPRDIDYKAVKLDLQRVPGVKSVHSLNVWSLTMDTVLVNVHLAVGNDVRWQSVTSAASELLRTKYQIFQSTIQVEQYLPNVMSNCEKCKLP